MRRVTELKFNVGTLSEKNIDDLDRYLDSENCGQIVVLNMGIRDHQEFENAMIEYLKNTNVVYTKGHISNEVTHDHPFYEDVILNHKTMVKSARTFIIQRKVSRQIMGNIEVIYCEVLPNRIGKVFYLSDGKILCYDKDDQCIVELSGPKTDELVGAIKERVYFHTSMYGTYNYREDELRLFGPPKK